MSDARVHRCVRGRGAGRARANETQKGATSVGVREELEQNRVERCARGGWVVRNGADIECGGVCL